MECVQILLAYGIKSSYAINSPNGINSSHRERINSLHGIATFHHGINPLIFCVDHG